MNNDVLQIGAQEELNPPDELRELHRMHWTIAGEAADTARDRFRTMTFSEFASWWRELEPHTQSTYEAEIRQRYSAILQRSTQEAVQAILRFQQPEPAR